MTPSPWRWWTSNSMRRLSSDTTGKDGDVISATIASDGVAVVVVKEEDMPVIEAAPDLFHAIGYLPTRIPDETPAEFLARIEVWWLEWAEPAYKRASKRQS